MYPRAVPRTRERLRREVLLRGTGALVGVGILFAGSLALELTDPGPFWPIVVATLIAGLVGVIVLKAAERLWKD